jgi:hypothetical protein
MNRPIGRAPRFGSRVTHLDDWDNWWDEERDRFTILDDERPTSGDPPNATRGSLARRVVRWLFVNGGISVVFLIGLFAFAFGAAILGYK